jgi:hypothetical protein
MRQTRVDACMEGARASVRVCECASVRVCECASVRVRVLVIYVCVRVRMRVYARVSECMNVCVQGGPRLAAPGNQKVR